jgi:hypothetical protein
MSIETSIPRSEQIINPHLIVEAAGLAVAGVMLEAQAEERTTLVEELQDRLNEAGLGVTDEELAAKELETQSNQPRGTYSQRTRAKVVDEVMAIQSGQGISRFQARIRAQRAAQIRRQRTAHGARPALY